MAASNETSAKIAILRMKQVIDRTKISRSTIYNKLNPKLSAYDPTFPRKFKLGASAVGWLESEVEAWVTKQANVSKGLPEQARETSVLNTVPTTSPPQSITKDASAKAHGVLELRVATIRTFLEERAKCATLVRYTELIDCAMLSKESENDWQMLDKILTDLSRESYKKSKVLLAAHIRNTNDPKTLPRESFFDLANALGLQYDNRARFLDKQLKDLFAHYCDPKYRTEKTLLWIEAVRKCHARVPSN